MTTICPNGHKITTDNFQTPVCKKCGITATHYNRNTGKVYFWMDTVKFEMGQERLQDELDAAFDNQYFSEW